MDKSILVQYTDMQEETKKLENRIDKIKQQSQMASDIVQNGYKRHAVIFGVDVIRQQKLENLYYTLSLRYNQLLELQNQVEEFINNIKDSKLRQIFEHRYIDQMCWFEIAMKLNLSGESVVRMKHDRYLEKF